MAFIVATKRGRFEVRESNATPRGPRSRTLASFTELDDRVIEAARAKASKPIDREDLRRAAKKVSAPIAAPPAERAARALIAELGKGRALDPTLRRILLDLLERGRRDGRQPSQWHEAAHEVAEWMAATPAEKGRALVDLLLLADALPSGGRHGKPLSFPRLDSTDR
ncbi:MAG TPA: hypothetical protein VFY04_08390 [Solirubrobacterales bacterium]|nr:hypothetical protein [Solirubrobacterales bacterium]